MHTFTNEQAIAVMIILWGRVLNSNGRRRGRRVDGTEDVDKKKKVPSKQKQNARDLTIYPSSSPPRFTSLLSSLKYDKLNVKSTISINMARILNDFIHVDEIMQILAVLKTLSRAGLLE